ncbi:MAG: hypothetical protein ACOCU4_02900 [Alkalispirochaeta sp.]
MNNRAVVRSIFITFLVFALSSCLTTEVSIDFRDSEEIGLQLVYTIPPEVWELGVFDATSPERAIPISARDAREAANLYDDVTLVEHHVREETDAVTVRIEYAIGSPESLADLWGWGGENRLQFDPESGRLQIPVNGDAVAVDSEQRELIREVFRDQQFRLTLRAPAEITTAGPELSDSSWEQGRAGDTAIWSAPMGQLLLHDRNAVVEARWEVPQ